ncbi:MAG: tetratricopeptide repeat protein [Phormidesmis sp.]
MFSINSVVQKFGSEVRSAQVYTSGISPQGDRRQNVYQQGDAYREGKKWEEAIACYQEYIRLNPEFSWAYHSLGDCYKNLGLWESAIAAYHKAATLNPGFVWSHYSLAEVLAGAQQLELAAESYQQVLVLDPSNEQVPPRLASVLQQLIERSPRRVDYYQSLAEQYFAEEKITEAIATYHMALQIQPDNSAIAIALADLIAEQAPARAIALRNRTVSKVLTQQDVHSPELLAEPKIVTLLLKYPHLFDAVYYRDCHKELSHLTDSALLAHYVEQGSAADYNPNPLFDNRFYLEQYPEVAQTGLNPLAHYHCFGYQLGYDSHPCFSTVTYQSLNPDVAAAEIDPLEHYLACGAQAGRVAFSEKQFPHILETQTPAVADYLKLLHSATEPTAETSEPVLAQSTSAQSLGLYCNTQGNYFITEIADFMAAALTRAGHFVTRLSEQDVPPEGLDGHWVIAPHEFFYLGEGLQWTRRAEWLKQAVMVNVEQPQTSWFSKAFHFLRHTRCIFDINVKSAAIMQALGLPAYWLPLGLLEDYQPFSASERLCDLRAVRSLPAKVRAHLPALSAPLVERPLDIHFIGTLNPRREEFFAHSARWLSEYRCFLHMPPMGMPLLKGQDQALDTEAVIGISRRSKILLNVHRDPLPYFEWHRMVFHGLWQNTLVVTEPCHDIPGLVAGEHFIACPLSEMAECVDWLLRNAEGIQTAERIRSAGHEALKARFDGANIAMRAACLVNNQLQC